MHRLSRTFIWAALALGGTAASAQVSPYDIPKSYGQPATPQVVAYVIQALQGGDLPDARALVNQYRRLNGDTPDALEAYSWLARGELLSGNLSQALKDANEIEQSAQTSLATRKLDSEPHLPLALGQAYEVEADALSKQGKRPEALQMLRRALVTWKGTSLVDRLQKNVNLFTIEGRPMPLLRETAWLGDKPVHPVNLRGKVVLLFFWAHWCSDCKAESPVIAQIAGDFEPRGLVVIAPTRLYGYTADEDNAPPATEKPFAAKVFEKYYGNIPNVQVPLDSGNFERFGASTTPTLVLVDRRGIVKLYHPGVMNLESLRTAIEPLLAEPNTTAKSAAAGR
ncbi:MAG TPA: tetratricopeptide repeat protein [Bryobacteraceae bacterium]|nr:tetratricopeptide repeat protein [Bryobacteraceae bacterium]